jgi:hypothetical protein
MDYFLIFLYGTHTHTLHTHEIYIYIFISIDVRVSLCTPRLISQALKLMTM